MKSLKAKLASLRVRDTTPDDCAPPTRQAVREGDQSRPAVERRRLVVAHFMLGNTYDFTEHDWRTTFEQVAATDLDGLALNLGPEDWQYEQAQTAFRILASSPYCPTSATARGSRPLRLFINLDMNVLPCTSLDDADGLRVKVVSLLKCAHKYSGKYEPEQPTEADEGLYLTWQGKRILGTFSGHAAALGGLGWAAWIEGVERDLVEKLCFWPSFFLPPQELASLPYAEGIFSWNAAWPMSQPTPETLAIAHTDPLLFGPFDNFGAGAEHGETSHGERKGYMTAVSPCFFTHYAKPGSTATGAWEWGKNWLYASDDLMMLRRWERLIELIQSDGRTPDIIQIISWNDYGESNHICPTVLGCQPGSEAWVNDMPHGAFGEMCKWMVGRWRDGKGEVDILSEIIRPEGGGGQEEKKGKVWMWYRPHPAEATATNDERGKPEHTDRAKDLINIVVLLPHTDTKDELELAILNGPLEGDAVHTQPLQHGKANQFTIPFVPGKVQATIRTAQRDSDVAQATQTIWDAQGRCIDAEPETWNCNFWSGSWDIRLV